MRINMKIIEYEEIYQEEVKELLEELQEYQQIKKDIVPLPKTIKKNILKK